MAEGRYDYEADVLVSNQRDGIQIRDLDEGDVLHIIMGHGAEWTHDLMIHVTNPYKREAAIFSTSTIHVIPHLATIEGVCMGVGEQIGTGSREGWLIIGLRPIFGAWVFPPILQILLNGTDITQSPVSKNN